VVADRLEFCCGEDSPGGTRTFQQALVFRTDMVQLLLDDLA
jgi:hypothetical protein